MDTRNRSGSEDVVVTASGGAVHGSRCEVTETWTGRTVVVAVAGDVDMLTAPYLADALHQAARKEPAALIADLSRVDFLASAGMNLLITAHRDIAPWAGFGVVADGPATSRPLRILGFDSIFALYRTLDDAMDDFG